MGSLLLSDAFVGDLGALQTAAGPVHLDRCWNDEERVATANVALTPGKWRTFLASFHLASFHLTSPTAVCSITTSDLRDLPQTIDTGKSARPYRSYSNSTVTRHSANRPHYGPAPTFISTSPQICGETRSNSDKSPKLFRTGKGSPPFHRGYFHIECSGCFEGRPSQVRKDQLLLTAAPVLTRESHCGPPAGLTSMRCDAMQVVSATESRTQRLERKFCGSLRLHRRRCVHNSPTSSLCVR
jgi:hypothetical protein